MSGVAAVYFRDGRPAHRPEVERMAERLAHRGPDGGGVWTEGPVGLGHRMLWTTPESLTERLPLSDAGGAFAVTADVRLDNRADLIAALGLDPHDKIGDGELILRAWQRWGTAAPEHLLGDFAFVVWDRRRQALFCARDPLGVKPLYYHCAARVFVVASEIKGLLGWPEVPRRLDETRVGDYLQPCLEDKAITFYRDVRRLPPAHWLLVGRDRVELREYWRLDPARELGGRSDAEHAEAFRSVFTEAVRCRLRSAGRVGSLLSGGLDSSSITCMARHLDATTPLPTFSAIFDEVRECDERPFIGAVLAQGGLEPHYVHADRLSPLGDLDRVFHHQDEAFYTPNLFMHWGLYRAARQQGIGVLLDGLDGDTTVSHGLALLAELLRHGRWITLAREVSALSRHFSRPASRFLRVYALSPLITPPVRRAWRRARGRPHGAASLIHPRFAARIGLEERVRQLQGDRARPARTSREEHWRKLTGGVIPFALEVTDRAAAAFGLEPRYPFFDRRLVELCLALPAEQKLHRGWTRMVMRRALAGVLPDEVRWRGDKSNLSPNFARGLLHFERPRLEAVVEDPTAIEEYVDVDALREAYRRYTTSGTAADALTVWTPVTLALWLRSAGPSL